MDKFENKKLVKTLILFLNGRKASYTGCLRSCKIVTKQYKDEVSNVELTGSHKNNMAYITITFSDLNVEKVAKDILDKVLYDVPIDAYTLRLDRVSMIEDMDVGIENEITHR